MEGKNQPSPPMKKSLSNQERKEAMLRLKSRGEQKVVEFKVGRLSSSLAHMIKEYRELTECNKVPAESLEACYLEMRIHQKTRELAELISRSGTE